MTYSQQNETGDSWLSLRQPEPKHANGASPPTAEGLLADRYYIDVFPECEPPCCSYPAEPTRVGDLAEWTPQHLSEADCAAAWRTQHRQALRSQIPMLTLTDEAEDKTSPAKAEQWYNKHKSALDALANTVDADLSVFNTDLASYQASEQDYASNVMMQETKNLLTDKELKDTGGAGLYTASEVSAMQSRIAWNEGVSQGTQTGVQTPDIGAPRGDTALEDEIAEKAIFVEVTFYWDGDLFIPQVTIPSIPDGQDPAQVFCMVYDHANVYRSWMPFEQQADGTWKTPSDASYTEIAKTGSANWRVAVAVNGTQSEFEITNRVYLVPPQVAESDVRFGGRT